LEPARYAQTFSVSAGPINPKTERPYGKETKTYQTWLNEQPKPVLTHEDDELFKAMREACVSHPVAKKLLGNGGRNEITVVWVDEATGMKCKCRLDRYCRYGRAWVIVDLKTTNSVTKDSFSRDIQKHLYHVQAAMYTDGLTAAVQKDWKWIFVCVEPEPPYEVATYQLDEGAIEIGRELYRGWLGQYKQCVETGVWPGYGQELEWISLPAWELKKHAEGAE
jgi:exodeoxyribonuclease VIII